VRGMRKLRSLLLVAVVAGAALGATSVPASARPEHSIRIRNFAFIQNQKLIFPGDTIVVVNQDGQNFGEPHSVTSKAGLFDTGPFVLGFRFITAPSTPGVYRYYCVIHSFMKGQLTVSP
jgi:plastocyanin